MQKGTPQAAISASQNLSTLAAALRVRCEHRNGRSKISVDGNNVNPRNGQFRARVRAAGGTVLLNAQGNVVARQGVECAFR